MLRATGPRSDGGFTLVELLIAITIMGVAVSALVLALSSLVVASQEGRGHSVSDTAAHSLAEAIQQKVSFTTKVTTAAGIPASGGFTVTLANPASDFQSTPPFDILVDQEIMTVTSTSGSSITVAGGDRAQGGSEASSHLINSVVSQDFICPTATFAANPANHSGYLFPNGFTQPTDSSGTQVATASIGEVDYWNPDSDTFTAANDTNTCLNNFQGTPANGNIGCPDTNMSLPECDPGVERVRLHVVTALANLRNVSTDTWVLIRRGGN
jgi:prepilin-type N-terminal cleavage/methylation domain-containing protein